MSENGYLIRFLRGEILYSNVPSGKFAEKLRMYTITKSHFIWDWTVVAQKHDLDRAEKMIQEVRRLYTMQSTIIPGSRRFTLSWLMILQQLKFSRQKIILKELNFVYIFEFHELALRIADKNNLMRKISILWLKRTHAVERGNKKKCRNFCIDPLLMCHIYAHCAYQDQKWCRFVHVVWPGAWKLYF